MRRLAVPCAVVLCLAGCGGDDEPAEALHRTGVHGHSAHVQRAELGLVAHTHVAAAWQQTPRGARYRYSVVFTNEDGGTPADAVPAGRAATS